MNVTVGGRMVDPKRALNPFDERDSVDALDEFTQPETTVGSVTKIRRVTDDKDNLVTHRVNVITARQNEERGVDIIPITQGGMYLPEKGDSVILYYQSGTDTDPVALGPLHTIQNTAPEMRPGDYRIRRFEDTAAAEFEVYQNNNDETIISATRQPEDGGDPDMGIELNLSTGEFKIGDGSGFGIVSDGSGNFTWYIQSLDYVSDGSTIDWTRPGSKPK